MTRYRVNPACTFLIRAFAPGCPTMLRGWSAKLCRGGERVTIVYDLPDGKAKLRAEELVRSAPTLHLVRVGRKVIRDLTAKIDDRLLTIEALLVVDAPAAARATAAAGARR